MELKMGTITKYNNKIVVAQQELGHGVRNLVNVEVIPSPVHSDFEGTNTKPSAVKKNNIIQYQNKKTQKTKKII